MKLGGSLRSQKISKNRKNPAVLNLKSRLIGLEMCRVYMTDVNGLQEDVECQYIYICQYHSISTFNSRPLG